MAMFADHRRGGTKIFGAVGLSLDSYGSADVKVVSALDSEPAIFGDNVTDRYQGIRNYRYAI